MKLTGLSVEGYQSLSTHILFWGFNSAPPVGSQSSSGLGLKAQQCQIISPGSDRLKGLDESNNLWHRTFWADLGADYYITSINNTSGNNNNCNQKNTSWGAPGWLSRLGNRLRLRSWSRGPWVQAPHRALYWQLRAWSLIHILCLPLSLTFPHSCSVSLCL